jgi:hypothetical protein
MAVALVVGVLVVAGCIAAPCVLMAFLRELAGGDDLLR